MTTKANAKAKATTADPYGMTTRKAKTNTTAKAKATATAGAKASVPALIQQLRGFQFNCTCQ
jgi:hypothetical protein